MGTVFSECLADTGVVKGAVCTCRWLCVVLLRDDVGSCTAKQTSRRLRDTHLICFETASGLCRDSMLMLVDLGNFFQMRIVDIAERGVACRAKVSARDNEKSRVKMLLLPTTFMPLSSLKVG